MKREEIVKSLLWIEKEIRGYYQSLASMEIQAKKEILDIYSNIRECCELEDILFSKFYMVYCNNKSISNLRRSLCDFYEITDDNNFLFMYVNDSDDNVIIRRLLEKIYPDFDQYEENEDIDSDIKTYEDEDSEDDIDSPREDDLFYEKGILFPLMEYEDSVQLIKKIDDLDEDEFTVNNIYCPPLDKKVLRKVKYDLIFLNDNLEKMMLGDYTIPTVIDSKAIASLKFNLFDERIDKAYDDIHELDIMNTVEFLSQRKNQKISYKNTLCYLLIDLWIEKMDDIKFNNIMEKIEDSVGTAYNDDIKKNRREVYNTLHKMYDNRIEHSEIIMKKEKKNKTKKKKKNK